MAVQDRHFDCSIPGSIQRELLADIGTDCVRRPTLRAGLSAGRSVGRFGLGRVGGSEPAVRDRTWRILKTFTPYVIRRCRAHVSSHRRRKTAPLVFGGHRLPDLGCEALQHRFIGGETRWRCTGRERRAARASTRPSPTNSIECDRLRRATCPTRGFVQNAPHALSYPVRHAAPAIAGHSRQ